MLPIKQIDVRDQNKQIIWVRGFFGTVVVIFIFCFCRFTKYLQSNILAKTALYWKWVAYTFSLTEIQTLIQVDYCYSTSVSRFFELLPDGITYHKVIYILSVSQIRMCKILWAFSFSCIACDRGNKCRGNYSVLYFPEELDV